MNKEIRQQEIASADSLRQETVNVKPSTRNHKGFFIQPASYKLMSIDQSGWALICIDDAVCHYVDPDNLQMSHKLPDSET